MKSEHFQLVSGAFAFEVGFGADFGTHPADNRRALKYLDAMQMSGLGWPEVEFDVRLYCEENQRANAGEQIKKAKKLWSSLKAH